MQFLDESDRIQFYSYVYYLTEAASSFSAEERGEILRLMSYSNNPAIATYGKTRQVTDLNHLCISFHSAEAAGPVLKLGCLKTIGGQA